MKYLGSSPTSIPVNEVSAKKRIRKDAGDIEDLKKSISEVGLLHPILINQKNELLSGERRLKAVKSLGWKTISAVIVHTDDELTKVNIELEENLHRRDFSYAELEEGINRRNRLREKKEMPYLLWLWKRLVEFIKTFFSAFFSIKNGTKPGAY
jgi:ParB family chromosome partitioning protein